jgi:V/A-type H+/Na+-transporting ATPase subunit K
VKSTKRLALAAIAMAALMTAIAVLIMIAASNTLTAQEITARASTDPELIRWAFISAAVAAGLSVLAAGYAVANIGSAAIGALAEKPELFGRLLILIGLAEGLAIYGLIVAILIFNRVS